jgi:hypothetical protein
MALNARGVAHDAESAQSLRYRCRDRFIQRADIIMEILQNRTTNNFRQSDSIATVENSIHISTSGPRLVSEIPSPTDHNTLNGDLFYDLF